MNVVLTRERGQNDRLRQWLPDGCDIAEIPATTTVFDDEDVVIARVRATGSWGRFETLVVTSARSVRYAARARDALVAHPECYSVGARTTAALRAAGLHVDAQSAGGAIDLAHQVTRSPVLVLGAATMRDELAEDLRRRGIIVEVVTCYETRRVDLDERDRATLAEADVVFVGAPSAWSGLADSVRASTWVVVPGATTASVVRATHARVLDGWGPSLRDRLIGLVHIEP